MGKKKRKIPKWKTIKMTCDVICPNCGENHFPYTTKKGKQKGINGLLFVHTYPFNPFRHNYHSYDCLTCGHKWEVRTD